VAVRGGGKRAPVINSDDDLSLQLQGVEGDGGVNQSTTRGSEEGRAPEEGIGSGGGSKSGYLGGGFRQQGGGHTITRSREGGVCFGVVGHW
jgi:hypothetical protein